MQWWRTWCARRSDAMRTRHDARLRAALGGLLMLALVAGCDARDPATGMLLDYRARVARVLEIDADDLVVPQLSAWPRPRRRTLAVPAEHADLLEFLDLQQCRLGPLIGERSSALGRVKQPSQLLRYELAFLQRAQDCLADPARRSDVDPDTVALLDGILADKRARLGAVVWNATLGDPALAANLALDVAPLAPATVAGAGRETTGALLRWASIAEDAGRTPVALDDWEVPWASIDRSRFGGRARRSVALLTVVLGQVADWLEARARTRPICPQHVATPRAQILSNVFAHYYAGRVQPYLADVSGEAGRWLDALAALRAAQRVTPPAGFETGAAPLLSHVGASGAGRGAEWDRFVAARDRHTRAWQQVLEQCAMAPGSRGPVSGDEAE